MGKISERQCVNCGLTYGVHAEGTNACPAAHTFFCQRPPPAPETRIVDPKTGGEKGRKDERYDLFPFDALDEVARVYAFGAKKYADDNWLKGYAWRLSAGALLRHVSRFMIGEDSDPETGCHHLAHAAWHCLTLITFEKRHLGTDDRAHAKVPA